VSTTAASATSAGSRQAELILTGERTLPGIAEENYWFRRHQAAYLAVAPFVRGAVVLEAGCGEGYGAALLAQHASRVLAVDLDATTVRHVRTRYPDTVSALRGDLQRLPLTAGAVEVVASLQTVEHLHDQAGFLRECARVLRPAGTLILSTPNRLTFSPGLARPLNPFHTRELDPAELDDLLAPAFLTVRRWGLRHGRRLRRWERRHGSLVETLLATPPPAWPAELAALVTSVTAADFVIDEAARENCLDLVAVAVRR
jgi:SAM-dependent methyltransferase